MTNSNASTGTGTKLAEAVSTEGMTLSFRWRRMLRFAGIAVGLLVIAMAALIAIQQHILRWRAERLLADVRELELGKSNWSDARRIMTRWGAWGFYEGSCTAQRCTYQIDIEDTYRAFPVYSPSSNRLHTEPRRCCNWMLLPYQVLGGRAAMVSVRVEVIGGIVWGKDFFLATWVPAKIGNDESGYVLSGSANTVWRTEEYRRDVVPSHPDYVIGRPGGCEGCVIAYSRFTPFADPAKVKVLMQFNLDCITHLVPCRDPMDIMPGAWKEYLDEEAVSVAERNRYKEPRKQVTDERFHPSPEFLGRDEANVVVAEVASTESRKESWGVQCFASFRLKRRLKRAAFWIVGDPGESGTPCAQTAVGKLASEQPLTVGRQVILAFDMPYGAMSHRFIDLSPNGILPLTDENLAAVERGIELDIFPDATVHFP